MADAVVVGSRLIDAITDVPQGDAKAARLEAGDGSRQMINLLNNSIGDLQHHSAG